MGSINSRFAETEAVVILTMLLQRYKIELKEEPQYANETFEERKKRLMYGRPTITLVYAAFPNIFNLADLMLLSDRLQYLLSSSGGGEDACSDLVMS